MFFHQKALNAAWRRVAFKLPAAFKMEQSIAHRLVAIREELGHSQKKMAEIAGIAFRTWQGIERGESIPSGTTLLKIASLGFSPTWILTGNGEKRLISGRARDNAQPLENKARATTTLGDNSDDAALFNEVLSVVQRVFARHQVRLSPPAMASETFAAYQTLIARASDPAEMRALLPWLEFQIEKGIQAAKAEPGTGKRQA